tara:strand:- start:498 stop:2018 length:1521 start_codon:yes stop_codon:yes gene_type:complete
MAYNIVIETAFFVINDTGTDEYIRHPREDVRFTVNSSSVYKFYEKATTQDGIGEPYVLGGNDNSFAYADLGTVTEDGVVIPIASATALTTYLSGKLSFFFNPNPVEVTLGSETVKVNNPTDAFGRLRVSHFNTQFDAKQIHDNLPLFIDQELIGTATSVHSTTNAQSVLSTTTSSDAAILQTKQRFNYSTGKSQLMFWTFNGFDNETDVTKRIGYFTTNTTTPFNSTLDGLFIQSNGTSLSVQCHRSGTQTASVDRASWDDPLDGTGASGITHDFDNNTILAVDFEWLGVGQVSFYVVKNRVLIPFHYIDFTDTIGVYMSSPNQPMRWEIRQNSTEGGSMNVICSTVGSEGSINKLGKVTGIDDDGTHLDANSTSNWYAAIGIRLQTAKVDTLVDIIGGYLMSDTNDNFIFRVEINPTIAGTFTYTSIANSALEYALGATANTISAHGYIIGVGGGDSNTTQQIDIENAIRLGANLDGTLDEVVVLVKPLSSHLDIYRGITFRELT